MDPATSLAIGDRGLRFFLLAFAITQLVETPIFERALRRSPSPRRPLLHRLALAFGASALTHPVVWFAMPRLTLALLDALSRTTAISLDLTSRTLAYGLLAEGFAVAAESLYLRALGVRRALVWSLFANAASVIVGAAVVQIPGLS